MTIATNPTTGEVMTLGENGQWEPAQTAVNPETKEMLAFDGRDWKPVPVSKGVVGYIDDAVRSIASGMTFGWADEFSAKMNEFIGKGTYEENVKQERARDAQIPVAIQLPGEIAGAVGSTLLVAPLAAWRAIAAISSSVPQAVRFGALGAAEGGLAGAGGATEGNRLKGAAGGAAIGAPVGAVAPSVVRGIEGTVNAVRTAVTPKAGAAADIGRAIVRDETTPEALIARLGTAQAERPGIATVADVGGENVRGLVERVAQTPGAGRTKVVPALTARQQGQLDRVSTDLRDLTGTTQTARQAIDETIAERATAARPLYDEAMAFDLTPHKDVQQVLLDAVSTGWGKAIINSSEFRRTLQTEYGIGEPSAKVLMPVIDAWKKQADDLVGRAVRNGENNKARVIGQMRDRVIAAVDEVNPKYAEARAAWAGPSKFLEAIEDGRNILSQKVSKDEVAAKLVKMSPSEQEAYRIGAVSAIQGKMGNDPAKLADLTKYLRSDEVRGKVSAMMPTPEAASAWERRLSFEVKSSELVGQSLGNSATARRLAEQKDASGVVGDLVMDALLSGPASTSVLRQIFTAGPRWLRDTLRSRTDKELADILTNPKRAADLPRLLNSARAAQGQAARRPTEAAAVTAGTIAASE